MSSKILKDYLSGENDFTDFLYEILRIFWNYLNMLETNIMLYTIITGCIATYIIISLFLTYLVHRIPRKPVHDPPDWGRVSDARIPTADGGYIEVSAYDRGKHTLRIESVGYDYDPVTIAFFGFNHQAGVISDDP